VEVSWNVVEIRILIEEKVEKRAEKGKDKKSIYKREGW